MPNVQNKTKTVSKRSKIFMWLRENVWVTCYEKVSYFYVYVTHSANGITQALYVWDESRLVPLKMIGVKNKIEEHFQQMFDNLCNLCETRAYYFWTHIFTRCFISKLNTVVTVFGKSLKYFSSHLLHTHKMNKCACTKKKKNYRSMVA